MEAKTPTRFEFRTPSKSTPRTPKFGSRLTTPVSQRAAANKTPGDRYVPNRAATDIQFARFRMSNHLRDENSPPQSDMLDKLLSLQGVSCSSSALGFGSTHKQNNKAENYWRQYTPQRPAATKKVSKARRLPKSADRVLDAPNIINDFYLNVLDWSSAGVLAIALRDTVYLLNTGNGSIDQLTVPSSDYVSSLAWGKTGKYLTLGTSNAEIQLWDVSVSKKIRQFKTHSSRVGALSWNTSNGLLSSGSQRGVVHQYDPRMAQYHLSSSQAHSLDVCGLKWSPNGRFLASGGNDNTVAVWDLYSKDPWSSPAHCLKEHNAAVKALSWCPWQSSVLATGGGSADKRVCVWNACTGSLKSSRDTESQVSGLLWSKHHKELLSAHGSPSNELAVWSCDPATLDLRPVGGLSGHDDRILHLTSSPDGQTVVSAGADETLRFWKVFTRSSKNSKSPTHKLDTLSLTDFIR